MIHHTLCSLRTENRKYAAEWPLPGSSTREKFVSDIVDVSDMCEDDIRTVTKEELAGDRC